MNRNARNWVMLAAVVAVALLATFWATTYWAPPSRWFPWRMRSPENILGDIELYYTIKTVISSINTTLLIFLLITYIDIYRKTQSEFTIGLIIFSMVLLLYALTTNPFVQWMFGFRAFGLGPFAMLPDVFTFTALAVLLYLTLRY